MLISENNLQCLQRINFEVAEYSLWYKFIIALFSFRKTLVIRGGYVTSDNHWIFRGTLCIFNPPYYGLAVFSFLYNLVN
jgi:hypothetical protein